jgi:glycine dehydrogenase
MMGSKNLKEATQIAILNANYIAKKLESDYEILFKNKQGRVAHELIINCKSFKRDAKVTVEDIAKRLMDYGFHSPTMSWPVPDTLMIEPTESEGKDEIDRFCLALSKIKNEIDDIINEKIQVNHSPLKNAPHSQNDLLADWAFTYSPQIAFFPIGSTNRKFWPSTNRIDNAYGDRNLICSCQTVETEINVNTYEINTR